MSKEATRDGFGKAITELGKNKDVYVLTADLGGSTRVNTFKKKYPKRFIQVGVAEQNLVTVASGLAKMNKKPFATTFAAFSPGRNWEQIRTTICYNDVPVKICSTHAGLGVGEDGATHQMLEDIAMMRALPNMIVISPCDSNQAYQATKAIYKKDKPCYLRLNRQKTETLSNNQKFEIGKAQIFNKGQKITLITTGPPTITAAEAVLKLENEGISVEHINIHTIKPIDKKTIIKSAKKTGKIMTVEDHQINGGLGDAVANVLGQNHPTKIKIHGVKDTFGESGTYEQLYDKYGLSSQKIYDEIKQFLK